MTYPHLTLSIALAATTMLLLASCGDDGGNTNADQTDSMMVDGITDQTMPDAMGEIDTPDTMPDFGPPLDLVQFDLRMFGDSSELVGVEICVHEVPQISCGVTGGDGWGTVMVPRNRRVHLTLRKEGYVSGLLQLDAIPGDDATQWAMFTEAEAAASAEAAGVTFDETRGHVLSVVLDDGVLGQDPNKVTDLTFEPTAAIGGTPAYGDLETGVDPSAMATTNGGVALLINANPGDWSLPYAHPRSLCEPLYSLGWNTEGDPNAFDVLLLPGHMTGFLMRCPTAARDYQECDPVAQDCTDTNRTKCAVTFADLDEDGATDVQGTRCVEPTATQMAGQSCERPDGIPGQDTCQAGAYCAYWGQPQGDPQPRVCFDHCVEDADCSNGDVCKGFSQGPSSSGQCVPPCDLTNDTCATGTTCSMFRSETSAETREIATCVFRRDGQEGDSCGDPEDCAAGLQCVNNGGALQCRPLCGAGMDCAMGQSCTMFNAPDPVLTGLGYCS